MAAPRSISSNCTSLAYAVEQAGVSPESLSWQLLDPSAYTGDFGATVEYITAETVGSGRAPQKGRPSGKTVGAQFEAYMRQHELQPFLPGFFINHPIESASTNKLRPAATNAPSVTGVTVSAYQGANFTEANGFVAGSGHDSIILYASGFRVAGNNGFKPTTDISASAIDAGGLTAESSPPAGAALQTCGFTADDVIPALTVSSTDGSISITSSSLKDGGALELEPGMFIHIGGDSAASKYGTATNTGWARIKEVTSTGITCDLTTFTPTADPASGRSTVQFFIPTRVFKDDIQCDSSRTTTYAFERRLGHADDTYPHEQAQLVTGSLPNQLDLAMPTKSDVKATLQFMSRESYRRDGSTAQLAPWAGANRAAFDRSALFNTTFDIKHALLYRHDGMTSNRTAVFGLITDGTFTLNNNAKAIEGWGVYGAFDINPGYLMVDTQVTALFTTVEALDLSEEGIDAGLFVIFARGNSGFILDVPLVTVQSSALTVEQGEPVMVNVTNQGNESDFGYAASMQFFDYLPDVATQVTTL